jgi:hypothetical protein
MSNKWGWYSSLYHLADQKIQNMEAITKIGIYECLTFISYRQDEVAVNNSNIKV